MIPITDAERHRGAQLAAALLAQHADRSTPSMVRLLDEVDPEMPRETVVLVYALVAIGARVGVAAMGQDSFLADARAFAAAWAAGDTPGAV